MMTDKHPQHRQRHEMILALTALTTAKVNEI
jgi:hypothetical protein